MINKNNYLVIYFPNWISLTKKNNIIGRKYNLSLKIDSGLNYLKFSFKQRKNPTALTHIIKMIAFRSFECVHRHGSICCRIYLSVKSLLSSGRQSFLCRLASFFQFFFYRFLCPLVRSNTRSNRVHHQLCNFLCLSTREKCIQFCVSNLLEL